MASYVYDIECFDSLFTVVFIPATTKLNSILYEYELADMAKDIQRKKDIIANNDISKFIITYDLKYNDTVALATFLVNEKPLLYGYNNHGYDDLLLNAIILNAGNTKFYNYNVRGYKVGPTGFLREISDNIINSYDKNFQYGEDSMLKRLATYNSPYTSIDLQKLNYITTISLKFIAILLKHYRIQDLPYHNISISKYVTEQDIEGTLIDDILDYNINDVLITKKLLHFSKKELIIRIETGKKYNVNVMSESKSSMANRLIEYYYKEITGSYPNKRRQTIRSTVNFAPLISDKIQFTANNFNSFLTLLKNTKLRIGYDTFKPFIINNGVKYQMGLGGIHSADRPMSIITDDTYDLVDYDFDSYYPFTILNLKIHPKHIPDIHFIPMLHKLVYERLDAKHKAKDKSLSDTERKAYKSKADILKIVINASYGKFGSTFHWLMDFAAMYKTTLNCQLGLLMIIERLTNAKFEVISANTDGVVTKVPHTRRVEYEAICLDTSKELNYTGEFTRYKEYYATNVNNYLAIKTDGTPKAKGAFVKDKTGLHDFLMKGYDMPIVAIAVYEYFVNKIPIRDTIMTHKDIYDFCKAQRIGRNYTPYMISIKNNAIHKKLLQSTIRYIVTTNGKPIVKVNPNATKTLKDGTVVNITREISLLANKTLTLFNDFIHYDNMSEYKLDYGYYISEANKLIYSINGTLTKNTKKTTGTLFDDL